MRQETHAVRRAISDLAGGQWGVVSRRQLLELGLSSSGIHRWTTERRLRRIHHGVYAVGHATLSVPGRLAAALLLAGPGSALSHITAAWWWGLLPLGRAEPIHVSVLGAARSTGAVTIHRPKRLERVLHRSLPVTPIAVTLLAVAARCPYTELRKALAEADYRGLLDQRAIECEIGQGRAGSAALRRALTSHLPQLARTRSALEDRFLALCESAGIELPAVNVRIGGWTVDALWRDQRLVVELDGHSAHATPAAVERDRRRELSLRQAGYRVLRYTWRQVTRNAPAVVADLRAELAPRSGRP